MSATDHDTVRIPASLNELEGVHQWARARMDSADVPEPLRYNVLLALSESVTNAIRHGCHEDPQQFVTIKSEAYPGTIAFEVQDSGAGFSPHDLPDPTIGGNLLKAGGRGVFLLKSLADSVRFDSSSNGTSVMFTFEWK